MGQLLDCLGIRKSEGREREVEEKEEGKDWRIQQGLEGGLGATGQRGFLCHSNGGRVQGGITTRGGRSSWIDTREYPVRCYSAGKYVQLAKPPNCIEAI